MRESAEKIANFAGPLRKVLGKGVADGVAEVAGLNVACRWFPGYTLQEETPHYNILMGKPLGINQFVV